jgi:hypothetical protein
VAVGILFATVADPKVGGINAEPVVLLNLRRLSQGDGRVSGPLLERESILRCMEVREGGIGPSNGSDRRGLHPVPEGPGAIGHHLACTGVSEEASSRSSFAADTRCSGGTRTRILATIRPTWRATTSALRRRRRCLLGRGVRVDQFDESFSAASAEEPFVQARFHLQGTHLAQLRRCCRREVPQSRTRSRPALTTRWTSVLARAVSLSARSTAPSGVRKRNITSTTGSPVASATATA